MKIQNLDFNDAQGIMQALNETVSYIKARTDRRPQVAIVLGSGLGGYVEQLKNTIVIPYEDIPNFPRPTVAGHSGKLCIGEISGKCVAVMQGRNHYYEGYETQTITFPIRVLKMLGAESLILTNACGAVSKHFAPGDLMIIENHLAHFCPSPLRGAHLEELGPRFTDMSRPYAPEYIELAKVCADELGISVRQGVYGYWPGPTYETAAEVRAYAVLGADVVGMSTVAEDMVAVNCGIKVLGISCVTNMTCIHARGKTSHEEVIEVMNKIADKFINLLNKVIEAM
ncbi:MAG: purine-nucleoside phosphorylase [Hungatella sp.]|nr:purine-nucleoside phosphorylase [Hungatella sp.]